MFGYFLGVKLCKFNVFTTHLAPNILVGPTIASVVILNPNVLRKFIDLLRHFCYVSGEKAGSMRYYQPLH